jgi:hypothetical protein
MRLRRLIQAVSVYHVKIAEYMDYMGIKKKLIELEKKDENLVKRGPIQNKLIESKHEAAEVAHN